MKNRKTLYLFIIFLVSIISYGAIKKDIYRQVRDNQNLLNDIYRQFIEECIIECEKSTISLTELYSQFKEWFRDSLPNYTFPIKNEVKEYFIRLWGSPEKRGFITYPSYPKSAC